MNSRAKDLDTQAATKTTFLRGELTNSEDELIDEFLGALRVADDGTFAGSVYLEGIAPGAHTLQVNGTSFDGNDRSANLGVIVAANTGPAGSLPATGGGNTAPLLVLAALTMIMLGALARRRA